MAPEKKDSKPTSDWVPVSEAHADGYWLTLNTAGLPDKNKARINIKGIEAILRAANLPPIQIASESWNPKSFPVVDGAGNDTLMLKQISFAPRVPTLTLAHEPNLSVTPLEPIGSDKSMGWKLNIKTSKIDHDLRMKYPRVGDKLAELFYQEWEQTVRSGIRLIGYHETLGTRFLSKSDRQEHLAKLALIDVVVSFFACAPLSEELNLPELIKKTQEIVKFFGISQLKGRAEVQVAVADREHHRHLFQDKGSMPDSEVSIMRKIHYPERYQSERNGSSARFATRLIPGGSILEPTLLSLLSNLLHPEPFVKVIGQT